MPRQAVPAIYSGNSNLTKRKFEGIMRKRHTIEIGYVPDTRFVNAVELFASIAQRIEHGPSKSGI